MEGSSIRIGPARTRPPDGAGEFSHEA